MIRAAIALVAALSFATIGVARADQTDISGTWSGMLAFPSGSLLFVITFKNDASGLTATAASPYQGGGEIPVDTVALSGGDLSFTIKKLGVAFEGSVAPGQISGKFSQNGTTVPLAMVPRSIGSTDLGGTWIGLLKTSGGNLLLGLHVTRGADGTLAATLDSPYQGAEDIPASNVASKDGTLTFAIAKLGASFSGKIGPSSIDGTFTQAGQSLPLTFVRP